MSPSDVENRFSKTLSRRHRANNPLQAGITAYLRPLPYNFIDVKLLPKKYTTYPPFLILSVNFISTTREWQAIYEGLNQSARHDLFASIATAFRPQAITHIAINAAISPGSANDGSENVMRSPSGINPIYGDFGPSSLLQPDANHSQPIQADFDAAFWISTTQNGGIIQTWAPLWTMFSRGNITEKARILGEGNGMQGLTREELGEDLVNVDVADFYVGIGYFAFSYLKRGARTVFGWEINGWSVEGLRRGCERNGWDCLVLRLDENGQLEEGGLVKIVQCLRYSRASGKCIVFWGDNQSAATVLDHVQRSCEEDGCSTLNLRHINLGLLPTARPSWPDAVKILGTEKVGWLHVHENVNIKEIAINTEKMVVEYQKLVQTTSKRTWNVTCCRVEQVKTYAPGVMHCVFDIELAPI